MSDYRFRNDSLETFVRRVASESPAPGGGAAAAVTTALAASLVAMVARFSKRQLEDASELAAAADAVGELVLELAQDDAEAYSEVLATYRLPQTAEARHDRVVAAVERAAQVPLEVARVAAEVAVMGCRLVREGNPNLQGDGAIAVLLADAAVQGAAKLVELNVALGNLEGDWLARSRHHVVVAGAAAREVKGSSQGLT